ncbi:MAG: hypothetical protein MUE61_02140 [Vicinamibacterales bacterium]|jgi:hypothetical protein|nr:hypothetical protein [Vicinamibacterales bacterium]
MGWVLTASGSLAGPLEFLDRPPAGHPQSEQRRVERADVVDAGTGAELRLTARPGGALRASLTWAELDASKVVQPNGDFHARIAGRQDVLVLVRTGNRLRVTRGDQTAVLLLDGADEDGLDLVQAVLAGSRAARAFRGVHRRLSQQSRESAPGVALDNLDVLLGILQGDTGAVDRRAPARREAGWRVSRVSCGAAPTCYAEYEGEVVAAWDDFSQCVDDVKWFPGLQEVCAFTWLLRAESAWFRFIGCSSIPLKVT